MIFISRCALALFLIAPFLASAQERATGSAIASAASKRIYDAAFSICVPSVPATHRDFPIANDLAPTYLPWAYLRDHGIDVTGDGTSVSVISGPAHGVLSTDGLVPGAYRYIPNEGYLGPDQMIFVIEMMGKTFKVIETVWVSNSPPEYGGCPVDYKLPPASTQ